MSERPEKVYKFLTPPDPIDEDVYYKEGMEKLQELLNDHPDDETLFQKFFEQNPCFLPGARDEFSSIGQGSGHGPFLDVLISQPKIRGIIKRIPDFMWIAYDSDYLVPVIVELEAPGKYLFTKEHTPTAHFYAARHQLEEWQTILSRPENVLGFYQDFSIPQDLRDLRFEPHYLLIYGRRSEFKDDVVRKQKRGYLMGKNQSIKSYDGVSPARNKNFVTCNVKDGRYITKTLSPLFRVGPLLDELLEIHGLTGGIDSMDFTSVERKDFLRKRIPYCLDYLSSGGTMVDRSESTIDFQMDE